MQKKIMLLRKGKKIEGKEGIPEGVRSLAK